MRSYNETSSSPMLFMSDFTMPQIEDTIMILILETNFKISTTGFILDVASPIKSAASWTLVGKPKLCHDNDFTSLCLHLQLHPTDGFNPTNGFSPTCRSNIQTLAYTHLVMPIIATTVDLDSSTQ
ncbi:hypothetical protein L1887_16501 [Cichorium endivia]|nr:hypothetical protein L1887_16501 [Cichorium endivia]